MFALLYTILLKLKVNTRSFPAALGGGTHRYTGIILSLVTYAIFAPMTYFFTPVHLGLLAVNIFLIKYNIVLASKLHKEIIRELQNFWLHQCSFVQQLIKEINAHYLR